MFCPNYKNKYVFDGFNEMIEALGGKPMTEEEFRSGSLRNQRTGQDYLAMEATYITYDRNGGNFLDETPQGKPSLLFQTLLSHFNGDRAKAIVAKSNVYSDEFFNWFGDWTAEEKNNVSKAVDENGEPMVLWHGTSEIFNKFEYDEDGSRGAHKVHDRHSFFFTDSQKKAFKYRRSATMACYLNMKNPAETSVKDGKFNTIDEYVEHENDLIKDPQYDSIFIERYDKEGGLRGMEPTKQWVVKKPNQIKSIANLGEFNPDTDNIYYLKKDVSFDEDREYFKAADIISSFGQELSQQLMNGETVSSRDLMRAMLSSGVFHSIDNKLARALSLHDVPVRIGYAMKNGELAKTVTDGPASVIFINPNELNQVSKGYVGVTLMHELVHAVTVDIINHPKTQADFEFVKVNHDVFNKIIKHIKHLDVHSKNVVDGMYALTNEKEFAACFASDPVVRAQICGLAEKIDRLNRKSNVLSALKHLVNTIVKAFGRRAVFNEKSLMSDINDYEETLTNYLIGAPIIERGNTDNSELKQVYAKADKGILSHEDFIESMKMLEKMQEVEKNYLATSGVQVHKIEEVQEMLHTRIQALKASLLDSVEKGRLISTTENQLEMFVIDEAGKYNAIQNLLKTAVPAMIETVDKLRNIRREHGVFTNADYMREMHANVGMYNKAFDTLESILVDGQNKIRIVEEYNKNLKPDQEKLTMDDIAAMEQSLKNAKSFSEEAIHVLEYMLKSNGIHTLKKKAKEVGYKGIDKYIDALNGNGYIDDISSLELLGGASDASANDAVRAISYMINTALNKAQFDTQDKQTDLLKLQKNLKRGEKGWHLYETDENGNFTGYLMRDLNFGRFKRDYIQAIENINRDLIKYFGLATLAIDNRVAPDGEAGKRTADIKIKKANGETVVKTYTAKEYFEEKKDEWLNAHCERKYKPEYYEYYSKLPQRIKDQLGAIRTQIESITSNYKNLYDADGVPHYEQLSDEDWEKLNKLWERRRFLRSPINEYGFEREGQDREDAEALANLYEELYGVPNPFKKKRDSTRKEKQYKKEQWEKARNAVISKYGKDSEELKKWDSRNSIRKLKENEFGEALVFLEIEKEFGDYKVNYGEEYEKLKQQKKDILSKYRMLNGEYDANSIPQVLLNALVELDRKMRSERYKSHGTDAQRVAKFKEIWDKYIKYVDTEQLIKAKEAARKEAQRQLAEIEDVDDETTENELMNIILGNTYGYITFDDDFFDVEGTFVPYSWLQRMEAVDEEFMETAPNDAWIDKQESDLLNHNFDESYNISYVPKRELYDNEENYSKIFGEKDKNGVRHGGSQTLQALYKGIFDTIHEANQMQNREFADDYLLPQQECTAMERLYRKSTYKGFWNFLKKIFGFGRIIGLSEDPNDIDINTAYQEQSAGRTQSISGVYPDGREFHVIPTPFTKPLEHPELISKDIVGITRDYYLMSSRYKERSIIRDDCELILDLIRNQEFKNSDRFGKFRKITDKIKLTGGNKEQSNTFNYAKKLIERDLYDIQRESVKFFGIDFTKLLSLLKRLTTARNLGMNPKVALVGFFTTMFTHTINGIVGYKYSKSDMFNAGIIAMNEFGSNFAGARFIGDRLTKNKLILLLEMLDMSDQSGRKSEHSNRNRILQAIYKNSTFGIMSAADIYSKATIAVATLLSYRLVDGQFMTKHMIEEKRLTVGEEEYKRLMHEFKKSDINAYNIFEGDSKAWKGKINSNDTSLKVKEEYKAAWEKIKNVAANKAIKNAEQADGMATRLQKAMMTRNFLGAFVLIHRQYIPLMLQQTWGKRVYDFDAQEYKGAQFRTLFNYCRNLWASNALAAAGAGAFIGLAFGGFSPIFLAGCGTISFASSLAYNIKHRNDKKSFKDVNKQFFGTGLGSVLNPFRAKHASIKEGQSQIDYDNEIANIYQIRQTFYEVMLINFAIAPIANLLAACADNVDKDDDRWKWLLLQTLAYWARAVQFETNSKYNLVDILNNVKSATAVTAVTDSYLEGLSTFGTGMASSLFFNMWGAGRNYAAASIVNDIQMAFFTLFGDESEFEYDSDDLIQNGTYEGYSESFRSSIKMTPFHNFFEQFIDPSAKRRYHETQVMKLDKFERRSWLYDWIWGYEDED